MKLKQFIDELLEIAKECNPEATDVVYSSDDEGNSFGVIDLGPSVGQFDGEQFVQLQDGESLSDYGEPSDFEPAVCVN
jgi:hypothetical protein